MDAKDFKNLMIETACQMLQKECVTFRTYYKLENFEITYTMKDEEADVILYDNGVSEVLFTMDFLTAAECWRSPVMVISPYFDKVIEKYHLEDNAVQVGPGFEVVKNEA